MQFALFCFLKLYLWVGDNQNEKLGINVLVNSLLGTQMENS